MSENTVSRVFLKVYKILVTFSNKLFFSKLLQEVLPSFSILWNLCNVEI